MNLNITQQSLALRFPELACHDVPADVLSVFVSDAGLQIQNDNQERADVMGHYLVAHMAAHYKKQKAGASGASMAGGALTSVSVGGVSKTFASPFSSAGDLSVSDRALLATIYGQEFLRLKGLFSSSRGFVL